MSMMMDRNKLARFLGKMFGGKRDLYKVFGYETNIQYGSIYAKYRRQDITARVIDAPANALWDNPPTIEIAGKAAFAKEWEDIAKRLDIWQVLSRADKLAGMGDYSIVVLGLTDGQQLERPLHPTKAKDLIYMQPYAIDTVEIAELVDDSTDPRYMLPKSYRVTPNQEYQTSKLLTPMPAFQVHASRVLHVIENPLVNTVYGNPRGIKIYNLLDDLLKIVGGTSETFWLTANRGMQVDVDKEMELTESDAKDLSEEIDEYFNQLRRTIRTRGVKINTLGSDVPNPKQVFEMLIALISGSTGIPKRILIGSEAGQLASEQDRSNWAERIDERRTSFGNPIIMQTLLTLSNAGVLPEFEAKDVTIRWPDAFKLSPLESANTSAQYARSAVNLAKALENPILMTPVEARGIIRLTGPAPVVGDDAENPESSTTEEKAAEEEVAADDVEEIKEIGETEA